LNEYESMLVSIFQRIALLHVSQRLIPQLFLFLSMLLILWITEDGFECYIIFFSFSNLLDFFIDCNDRFFGYFGVWTVAKLIKLHDF